MPEVRAGPEPRTIAATAGASRPVPLRRLVTRPLPVTALPPLVRQVVTSPGELLDAQTRAFMEPRFGFDLSQIRIHADARGAESARASHALAYTVGRELVFGAGAYAPASSGGRALLGHELAHAVQQQGMPGSGDGAEPDRISESSAAVAGADIAAGQAVTRELPGRSAGLARSAVDPDLLSDDALAQQLVEYAKKVAQPPYPGQKGDIDWYQQLLAVAERRIGARQREAAEVEAARQRVVAAAEAARQREAARAKEERERAAAIAEAEEILNRPTPEADDDDTKAATKPADTYRLPSRFMPGGFTDEDIYKEYNESKKRIDAAKAHDDRVAEKPYKDRLYRARANISNRPPFPSDFRKFTPEEVWEEGVADDLFLESEKGAVLADQRAMVEANQERQKEESRQIRVQAEVKREMAWEAQGEALRSPAPFIQPFAFGALGPLVGAAYGGTQTGAVVGQTYNAFAHGTTGDKVEAVGSVAAMYFAHRAMRNLSGEPAPIARGEPAPPIPSSSEPRLGEPPASQTAPPRKPVITAHADESGVTFHEVKHPSDVVGAPPPRQVPPPVPASAPAPPPRRIVVAPASKSANPKASQPKPPQRPRGSKKGPITAAPKAGPSLPEGYEDMPEHTGMSEADTPPGSGTERPKTTAGNVAHRIPEILQNDPEVLKRLKQSTGSAQIFDTALPEGLTPEYQIPHPDYPAQARPRIDRLWRAGRTIYEIKPNTKEATRGAVQAMQYAEWMERFGELPPGGGHWETKVITYDQAAMLKFLKDIGYLP